MKLPPLLLAAAAAALAGCAAAPQPPLTGYRFPPAALPEGVARSNRDLAVDFLDLTFALESGETLDRLLRYDAPVRVSMTAPALEPYRGDLDALLGRLRREAGIDIARVSDPAEAQLRIEAVPAEEIARVYPTAACFIVPGETDWRGFLRHRGEQQVRWSAQTRLSRAAIFLPPDSTPQDIRDCLNEEITQALGPANDLYRLPDSIWNDDNFHGLATSFDMLMLRALYQPEFRSGMTREAVAAALPKVLRRVNPAGRGLPRAERAPESSEWASAIETALARDGTRANRLAAAADAVAMARAMRPVDHRLGVSLLTYGRLALRDDPVTAAKSFAEAYRVLRDIDGAEGIRTAQAGVHVAALALGTGNFETAVRLADRHVPGAKAGQNAILLAGLLSIKAEALDALGDTEAARAARLDSLRWARYGFGDADGALAREQAQVSEIGRLGEG